ncbi:hypothetical protein KIL84_012733 [Mauremys mutica]|uniref:Uncharacterized protein n=1 Tax=Mauremys mutica TaxID=74926 RepID=A0A9D3XRM7_9SAUR|nr:hypothetical protein KIL84_012733 [Mauremys mutica]
MSRGDRRCWLDMYLGLEDCILITEHDDLSMRFVHDPNNVQGELKQWELQQKAKEFQMEEQRLADRKRERFD